MNKNFEHIDQYFKDVFETFAVAPSASPWNAIANDLAGSKIDDSFASLASFEHSPPSNIFEQIQSTLNLDNAAEKLGDITIAPPSSLFDNIVSELDHSSIDTAFASLESTEVEPGQAIWEKISEEIKDSNVDRAFATLQGIEVADIDGLWESFVTLWEGAQLDEVFADAASGFETLPSAEIGNSIFETLDEGSLDTYFAGALGNFEAELPAEGFEGIFERIVSDSIDQPVREKLEENEEEPRAAIWPLIRRRIPVSIPLRTTLRRASRIAAILVVGLLLTFLVNNYINIGTGPTIVTDDKNDEVIENKSDANPRKVDRDNRNKQKELKPAQPALEGMNTKKSRLNNIASEEQNDVDINTNLIVNGLQPIQVDENNTTNGMAVDQGGSNQQVPPTIINNDGKNQYEQPGQNNRNSNIPLKVVDRIGGLASNGVGSNNNSASGGDSRINRTYIQPIERLNNNLTTLPSIWASALNGKPDIREIDKSLLDKILTDIEASDDLFKSRGGLYAISSVEFKNTWVLSNQIRSNVVQITNFPEYAINFGYATGAGLGYEFTDPLGNVLWSLQAEYLFANRTGQKYVERGVGTGTMNSHLKLNYHNIPLTVKYRVNRITSSLPLSWNMIVGAQMGWLKSQEYSREGVVLDGDIEEVINTEIGIILGMEYDYYLSKKMFVSFGGRASIGADGNNPFDSNNAKHLNFGLRAALNYRFQ